MAQSARFETEGSLARDSPVALCYVLEQDFYPTLSNALTQITLLHD